MLNISNHVLGSFKPCYKWNTFNTRMLYSRNLKDKVLNLVISGIPSIHIMKSLGVVGGSFKPCYKWNTFNTKFKRM